MIKYRHFKAILSKIQPKLWKMLHMQTWREREGMKTVLLDKWSLFGNYIVLSINKGLLKCIIWTLSNLSSGIYSKVVFHKYLNVHV